MDPCDLGQGATEKLISCVKKGECILFLGAGVHTPPPSDSQWVYPEEARPPLGRELAEMLAKQCDFATTIPGENLDLQRVTLCYETTEGLGPRALVEFLLRHLSDGKRPSPALRMLASLPFKVIVTTNYDRLFERALHDCGKEEFRLVYDQELGVHSKDMLEDPTPDRPLLFKIHGDLDDEDSIVITDEDYIRFVQRMSEKDPCHPIPWAVRTYMRKWPVLFVGYSLRDYNLRLLFLTLRWQLDPAKFPVSYSVDLSPDPLIRKVWKDQYVTFVVKNLWEFVPWLYERVFDREFSAG